jgi:hypothetical protein
LCGTLLLKKGEEMIITPHPLPEKGEDVIIPPSPCPKKGEERMSKLHKNKLSCVACLMVSILAM